MVPPSLCHLERPRPDFRHSDRWDSAEPTGASSFAALQPLAAAAGSRGATVEAVAPAKESVTEIMVSPVRFWPSAPGFSGRSGLTWPVFAGIFTARSTGWVLLTSRIMRGQKQTACGRRRRVGLAPLLERID